MIVRFFPVDRSAPANKLADAELVFEDGPLQGKRLVGFTVWQSIRTAARTVEPPEPQLMMYAAHHAYALLGPDAPSSTREAMQQLILDAYAAYERDVPQPPTQRAGGDE